ncbi:3-oxoadipate enol-lactonase [Amycolatopsis marina]|uniref:3-oxoadipate enol-lactonase n=1 Tax=Amycolatopsis marina TaxID=490629 RepID=A0A1I0WS91_9PSEU|nr:3-oxoadipate enol-lactonase [Amycolatopsis marina]SFA90823.1 3-oxoadipate enol-lactonase [Amycolatopsis marina]
MTVAVNHVVDGPGNGRDGGDSEVVVLSGSLGSDLRMWQPQVAPLTGAGYRVVRYDHRGHGGSPATQGPYDLSDLGGDLLSLLDALGVEAAHVAGLSLGGMVGMWVGAHAPERVRSLTLCCTSAELGPRGMWSERAELVRVRGMAPIADAALERWFTRGWRAGNPRRAEEFGEMIRATDPVGYAGCCAAIENMDLLGALPRITAPTLVISAAEDPSTPPEHGRRIAEAVAGARLEIVREAAHLGNVQQPERFADLMVEHLEVQKHE